MKVICIDDKWENIGGDVKQWPVFGEITTVVYAFKDYQGEWYKFQEYDYNWDYEQCGFIPLSEINETEFERNYQKETA